MPYIKPFEIERVRQIDLLSYLQRYEPDELVKIGADTYCTKTHDSLKLSHGRWYWWSRGKGSSSALDYLTWVKGMSFLEAIDLLGARELPLPNEVPARRTQQFSQKGEFTLPKPAWSNDAASIYLMRRGIDRSIISHCLKEGLLYGSWHGCNANVVFVGKDKTGKARYASVRGVKGDFKGEAVGSDKQFAFRLSSRYLTEDVHIFEGAIDALSYATLMLDTGRSWKTMNLLSIGGVSPASGNRKQPQLPRALAQYLANNPQTRQVYLHLDNDEPGRTAAQAISSALASRDIEATVSPPPEGKDVNEYLMMHRQMQGSKKTTPKHDRGQAR